MVGDRRIIPAGNVAVSLLMQSAKAIEFRP